VRSAPDDVTEMLASLAIFADLSRPELERVAHTLEERYFAQDERVLREGLSGSAFYIILEGEAAAIAGGRRVNTLGRGEFFGEISVLLGQAPVADIVATRPLRCLVLPGELLKEFLQTNPRVCYRILVAEARKLANAVRSGT
jgi:CRP/FNR family transcriptional regulator, cyclic AMP receptor protein